MVRGQFSGRGIRAPSSVPQELVASDGRRYPVPSAAATFENTFAIWLPMVSRITVTRIETRIRTSTNTPTVMPTAMPTFPPVGAAGPPAWVAGSQAWPFQRHRRSGDTPGVHEAPPHHQKPSSENLAWLCPGGRLLIRATAEPNP